MMGDENYRFDAGITPFKSAAFSGRFLMFSGRKHIKGTAFFEAIFDISMRNASHTKFYHEYYLLGTLCGAQIITFSPHDAPSW